jgi:cobalt-zinc-cadmium efflux system outer membrane protein
MGTRPAARTLARSLAHLARILVPAVTLTAAALAQGPPVDDGARTGAGLALTSTVDPVQAVSSVDLVRRALAANEGLAAARLDIERARARLAQAGRRPNPTLDVEHRTGRLTGSRGEGETTIGFALPLELGGQRGRRVELAEAELAAAEAEIADRERRLAGEVRALYADALAAARELETTSTLNTIDTETAHFVEVRVTEGETAPLELRLLQVEIDRALSRRAVLAGRLEAVLIELATVAGLRPGEQIHLREDLTAIAWVDTPPTVGEAQEIALRTRPDLRLAVLEQQVAEAGLRLARAQSSPEVTAFSRFSIERSVFDETPVGVLRDRDKTLAFGVSVGLPVFSRNQGARAEAALAIEQARRRRAFAEQRVRADVASAYARYRAAESAVVTFERGVIARSIENIRSIRGAYQIGAYRITELLAEQRRFADAQAAYTETLVERYRALADLQSAMGVPAAVVERPRPHTSVRPPRRRAPPTPVSASFPRNKEYRDGHE